MTVLQPEAPRPRGRIAATLRALPPVWRPGGPRGPLPAYVGAVAFGAVWLGALGLWGLELAAAPVTAALFLYAVAAIAAGAAMWRTYPHPELGLGNMVTLLRLVLTSALLLPLMMGGAQAQELQWAVFGLALTALALDGADGWLARRQGLASSFGARFDMEVDSALGMLLALNVFASGTAGAAVLLLGLPRYVFAALGHALPWMARPLPDRFGRKLVCVLQIGVLISVQAPVVPQAIAGAAITVAALALAWSFGRDTIWLWRRRG